MKALISTMMALALVFSMAACTNRNSEVSSSSSSVPSSSLPSSEPSSSVPPSSSDRMDDLGDDVSDVVSDVASDVGDTVSRVESAITPTISTDFEKIGALQGASEPVKWGPGIQVDEHNRTTAPVQLQELYGSYNAYFIAPEGCGKLYLTFDEGYENGYTPAILDVLKEKNVSAVFFITMPFAKSQPELVQRMIDEGHVVGNHTNRHLVPTEVSLEQAYQDIKELHDYVKENFNYEMYLYRPPTGAFSELSLAMVQKTGYHTVLWSFAYADWDPDKQPSYEEGLARTTKFIHEGAIYLLHAVSKTNAEILPALIDEIRQQGLEIAKWDL